MFQNLIVPYFHPIKWHSACCVAYKRHVVIKGVFLVNTLLIRICSFFSFVFAINSTTNQNVLVFKKNCYGWKFRSTNHNLIFKIPGLTLTNQITDIFKLGVIPASVLAFQKLLAAVSISLAFAKYCISVSHPPHPTPLFMFHIAKIFQFSVYHTMYTWFILLLHVYFISFCFSLVLIHSYNIFHVYVLWSGEPQFIFYSLKKLVIHAYSCIISNLNYALK